LEIRDNYKGRLSRIDKNYESKDSDYIFLSFVLDYLPAGLIGLLLAVIFSAAMSSTAGELNALASTTTIDYYKKFWSKSEDDRKDLRMSKLFTAGWGVLAIIIALSAGLVENLIQLVNILGSLFYGTILGVFLVAFFFKKVQAKATLFAAIFGQSLVLTLHFLNITGNLGSGLGYLHYNIIGSIGVVLVALLLQMLVGGQNRSPEELEA
jgi:SSS family solute:Na+ symporter